MSFVRHCQTCAGDVHVATWFGDNPGEHWVLVNTPMEITHEDSADGSAIKMTAEQKVGLKACAELAQRFPDYYARLRLQREEERLA